MGSRFGTASDDLMSMSRGWDPGPLRFCSYECVTHVVVRGPRRHILHVVTVEVPFVWLRYLSSCVSLRRTMLSGVWALPWEIKVHCGPMFCYTDLGRRVGNELKIQWTRVWVLRSAGDVYDRNGWYIPQLIVMDGTFHSICLPRRCKLIPRTVSGITNKY